MKKAPIRNGLESITALVFSTCGISLQVHFREQPAECIVAGKQAICCPSFGAA
ncbi:MAG: hypothetical protein Q7T18_08310 [Sedimentisphaerales bacterium]|nr:hypothetical protein [Sedimentisphaerales bacterium]